VSDSGFLCDNAADGYPRPGCRVLSVRSEGSTRPVVGIRFTRPETLPFLLSEQVTRQAEFAPDRS